MPSEGKILDFACGAGRHLRYCLEQGHAVVGVDNDLSRVEDLRENPQLELIEANLEDERPWPIKGRKFAAVLVCNYLHRPKLMELLEYVDEGGVLIYETYAKGNEKYRRPKNPAYLLAPGELLEVVSKDPGFYVMRYEHGLHLVRFPKSSTPELAVVQRICAVRLRPGGEFFSIDLCDGP